MENENKERNRVIKLLTKKRENDMEKNESKTKKDGEEEPNEL